MSLTVKLHGHPTGEDSWRIEISAEEWMFQTREEMEKALKVLLDYKENNGRIKQMELQRARSKQLVPEAIPATTITTTTMPYTVRYGGNE